MLLSSTIIILREVLEGAILISVLLALCSNRSLSLRWSWIAGIVGISGACVYASNLESISSWLDYTGQEITNAAIHIMTALFMCLFALLYRSSRRTNTFALYTVMTITASLTVVSEGSEILLFLSAYLANSEALPSVILGSIIGAGIGTSIGALVYYFISYQLTTQRNGIAFIILALFSAGRLSHAVNMLTQADWLPAQHVLWDTSGWLPENSLTGQLLYAVMGYEATPTANQLAAYISGILLLLVIPALHNKLPGQRMKK